MEKLVLIRHGESQWNLENRFTGWADVDLTDTGRQQARQAGQILKKNGYTFDQGFTSVLRRAIKTLDYVLDGAECLWIPVQKSWRLNERFYGALQGLNKAETAEKYGAEQVQLWRRDPHALPPAVTLEDPRFPGHDIRYKHLTDRELPLTENLSSTMARVMPFWTERIVRAMRHQQKVVVAAHGNSLRALVQYIDKLSDEEVTKLEIPTGVPLVYELDDNIDKIQHYYLQ